MVRWVWDVLSLRCPWDVGVDMYSQSEVWAGDTYLGVVMMAEVPSQGTCAWLQADSEN